MTFRKRSREMKWPSPSMICQSCAVSRVMPRMSFAATAAPNCRSARKTAVWMLEFCGGGAAARRTAATISMLMASLLQFSASRCFGAHEAQEHVLEIGIAGRDIDDAEAFRCQGCEHLARIHLVLAIGDLECPLVD